MAGGLSTGQQCCGGVPCRDVEPVVADCETSTDQPCGLSSTENASCETETDCCQPGVLRLTSNSLAEITKKHFCTSSGLDSTEIDERCRPIPICCASTVVKPLEKESSCKSKRTPCSSLTIGNSNTTKLSCGSKTDRERASEVGLQEIATCDSEKGCCESTESACTKPTENQKCAENKGCCGVTAKKTCKISTKCCTVTEKESIESETKCCEIDRCRSVAVAIDIERGCDSLGMKTEPILPEKDLEKGSGGLEHVIVSVEGMTCTGCETKLLQSLEAIQGTCNIRTSIVLAEADFDINLGLFEGTVEGAVKTLERMTNFTCTQVIQQGVKLEIAVGGEITTFVNQKVPIGVYTVNATGKHQAEIIYNPRSIGARDVIRSMLDASDVLLPISHGAVRESNKSFLHELGLTILSTVLTIPVLVLSWGNWPEGTEIRYGAVMLVLATVVQLVIAGPFYPRALKALFFARVLEMDLLIVISTTTAYVYSVIAYAFNAANQPLEVENFFETSTLLITLIMCGRVATAYARQKAIKSVSVKSLQAAEATIINSEGEEVVIDTRLLQYGDIFKVYPDMLVPTDGAILSGTTEVDESMITGEGRLIYKEKYASMIAGSVNRTGTVTARLTHLLNENTVSKVSDMVNEANYSKPKIQELADRVARCFIPTIFAITIFVFVIWIGVASTIQNESVGDAAIVALTYALSTLIVSCPCAIGLAVPMAIVMAGGVAAKNGLIFRVGETITLARKVNHVIFDKTGTLTTGRPSVVAEYFTGDSTLALVLALAMESKHPSSVAVTVHLKSGNISPAFISGTTSIIGKGVEATQILEDTATNIRGGNPHWLGVDSHPRILSLLSENLTVFCVTRDSNLIAAYGLRDELRPDAKFVVSQLQSRKIGISLVSGDEENAVRAVATELNIPESNIRFRCSPADKKAYIQSLQAERSKSNPTITLFIGDGTNDAPALAQADIGVHVNDGTEVAKNASDVVLLTPALDGVLVLMSLSTAVVNRIRFNFFWAFVYNTFAILLAAGAFVDFRIEPAYAGLGELVSVLPVLAAALQLRWVNLRKS